MSPQKRRTSTVSECDNSTSKKQRTRRSAPSCIASVSPSRTPLSRSRSISVDGLQLRSGPSSVTNGSARATSSPSVDKYVVQDDELVEDEEIGNLLGESEPEPEDKKTLPVRILSYFDIYDYQTDERKVLPMSINPDEDEVFFGASGLIRPQLQLEDEEVDWDSDAEDDESVPVKLSAIRDVWTDRHEIWIQTHHAWYILEYPSRNFRKYYERMKVLAQNYSNRSSSRPSRAGGSSTPFVTPRVGRIAQGLFLRSLLMLNKHVVTDPELQNICVPDVPFVVHDTNPTALTWGERITHSGTTFYKSVFLDGVEYHTLDTVAVSSPGSSSSAEDGDGTLSKSAWFAQIRYFFDRIEKVGRQTTVEKYFHLRWFSHGSQTILAETANPQALFLLDECDDSPVESILQKITVRHLGVGDLEPVVISDDDAHLLIMDEHFSCSHKFDSDSLTMSTVDFAAEQSPASSTGLAYAEQPTYMQCYACAVRQQKEVLENCNKLNAGVLEIYDTAYHVHDFVYVKNKQSLLEVAQIVDLLPSSGRSDLQISFFERALHACDEEHNPRQQRSLLYTGKVEKVLAERLDGHCFVARMSEIEDIDAWLQGPDNFILLQHKKPLKQCGHCVAAHRAQLESEKLVKAGPLLRALDLFSGAGGLTTGMDLSGYIKTCWAVELSPSAAQSLKANHEDVTMYNQDCNTLLKHAADLQAGRNPPALRSLGYEKEVLPPLPPPGEVDLIMGGPPCQPFSGMNRYKRVDDIRQTCIPTMLSYVEFYCPQYVLIENVTGLLHYRLKGRQEGQRIVGGIEAGMVKFIMRTFTSLGYQCQIKVLNSADYGSPQQRNRVIFWGARLDLALPKWPKPTHIPRQGHNSVIRRISDIGYAPVASRNKFEEGHQHAPFYSVTIKEAIDDLPSWDWENPGILYPKAAKGSQTAKETFSADTTQWRSNSEDAQEVSGYNYPVLYASIPRTLYQLACRKGQSKFARVEYHYTALFPSGIVERTVNIPVRPLANFKDLPQPLRHANSVKGRREGRVTTNDKYWRLDPDEQFRTMMTTLSPASKGAFVIHPTDKRVLTVREVARAQGFPDNYEFCSVEERTNLQVKDMYRQIGNAVPVHLAYALGRALGEGLVQVEISRRRDQNEEVSMEGWDARSDISEEL